MKHHPKLFRLGAKGSGADQYDKSSDSASFNFILYDAVRTSSDFLHTGNAKKSLACNKGIIARFYIVNMTYVVVV